MPNLISPALSLSAALAWGAADFSGGMATKRANTFHVVAVAHATGLAFMAALALLWGEAVPGWHTLAWGAAGGLVGGIGLAAFYQALAIGTMGINAPLSAVITALVPLLFSFRTEGMPQALQVAGIGLALVSIWLVAAPHGMTAHSKGVALAVLAGLGFGGFLVCLKLAGSRSIFWPLVSARAASCLMMLSIVLLAGRPFKAGRGVLAWMIVAGLLDSGANALYVAAAQRGRLDVAAVLSSLYPASTVVLARLLLKERLSPLQVAGMIAALVSVVLIAGG